MTLNAATGAINGTPTQNGPYNFRITASGAGALPNGLPLNASTGAVTGLPAQAGSFNFTIRASLGSCAGQRNYTVTVGCPAITLPALGGATTGASYSGSVAASPSGSYTYSLTTGSLPGGLTLNTSTGAINGTPSVPGTFTFTIKALTANGCSAAQSYTLTVGCPAITLGSLPNGAPAQLYINSATASPNGSYTYTVTSGSLPPGVTLYSSLGMLFGYPTTAGSHNFTITVTNSNNCTGSKSYSLAIGGAASQSLVFGDFDGDGKADLSVWRGSETNWYILLSGRSSDDAVQSVSWGASNLGDVPVPGDFDGDGKADVAVWRASEGSWYAQLSRDNSVLTKVHGQPGDSPALAKSRP